MGFAKDAPCASSNVIQQFFGSASLFDKIGVMVRHCRGRLDRDRDGLLIFFVGVVLFRVAAAVNFVTLVAVAPVVVLAGRGAISC